MKRAVMIIAAFIAAALITVAAQAEGPRDGSQPGSTIQSQG